MNFQEFRFAKLTATMLVLVGGVVGSASIGCGPTSIPADSSGEEEVLDGDAYAEQMAEEQKRVAKELRGQ